jgi:hypothetical protein
MVRVAEDKTQVRTARWSLLGALGTGVLAVILLSVFREPPPQPAPQRSLTSTPVLWTCAVNPAHEFTAPGRFDPMPCRFGGCGGVCSIHLRLVCAEHPTPFDAWVLFERTGAGTQDEAARIARYRYAPAGPWRETDDGRVPCPVPGCDGSTRSPHTAWSTQDVRSDRRTEPDRDDSP